MKRNLNKTTSLVVQVCTCAVIWLALIVQCEATAAGKIYPTCPESEPRVTVCTNCLAADYEKSTPPPRINGSARPIQFQFHVLDIKDVNVKTMEITIQGYLRLFWVDHRLSATCMHVNQTFMMLDIVNAQKLWLPDVYVVGVKKLESPSLLTKPASLRLYNTGVLRYSQYVTLTVGCPMYFSKFPMDTQHCRIAFESYGYTSDDVIYQWQGVGLERNEQFSVGQFAVTLERKGPTQNEYAGYAGSFPLLDFDVVLSRKLSHYLMQTIVPSILLILMSGVSYTIPPNLLPARMLLCVATILSTTTQFSGAQAQLPQVSYLKAIDVWMLACLTFETVSLVELCVVVYLKYGRTSAEAATTAAASDSKQNEKSAGESAPARNNKLNKVHALAPVSDNSAFLAPILPSMVTSEGKKMLDQQDTAWQMEDKAVPETTVLQRQFMDEQQKEKLFDARSIDWFMLKAFPLAFLVFNLCFWPFYLHIKPDKN